MSNLVRLVRGLGALAVLVGVVVGVPVLLVALDLVPSGLPTVDQVVAVLGVRDDGQLLRWVLGGGVWICWLLFTTATAAEVATLVRARPAPSLPGLHAVQQPVAALLAAVVVGLTLAPTVAATSAGSAFTDRPPLPMVSLSDVVEPMPVGPVLQPVSVSAPTLEPDVRPTYQVQRRDTLWALADRYLGDPLRYPEIVQLNAGSVGPDNRIVPGAVLVLPADATGLSAGAADAAVVAPTGESEVTVEPGNTLWGITEAATGDGRGWPAVWNSNAGRAEPGGATFDDPDLLRPGWTLHIPSAGDDQPGPPAPTPDAPASEPQPGPLPYPVPQPSGTPAPASTPDDPSTPSSISQRPTEATADRTSSEESEAHDRSSVGLVAATGGGGLLAGVSLLALDRYRRRQFRHRRPGRLVSATPSTLIPMERALLAASTTDVQWLDHALRSIFHGNSQLVPDVIAVCMTDDVLCLVLASPAADAPEPWQVDPTATRWSIRRGESLPYDEGRRAHTFAPFPALVSVGCTTGGERWLLDLERIGVLHIVGDTARGLDLLRFLAAELAHNTWSEMLRVTVAGFGAELAELNPDRLALAGDVQEAVAGLVRLHESRTKAVQHLGTDALTGRLRDEDADGWAPQVLLAGPAAGLDDERWAGLVEGLSGQVSRTGIAVVRVVGEESLDGHGWQVLVDHDGLMRIPALHIEVRAHQLPAEEAAPLARMLALASITDDSPIPPARGSETWDDGVDACGGALRPADDGNAAERSTEPSAPTVDSLLPLPDAAYLRAAATTEHDIRVLAPVTDAEGRRKSESLDPLLDQDFADWTDRASSRPKLTLLGPVSVRAQGSLPERNPRRQFYTEIVAYLATRPGGATSEQYATAIWPNEPGVVGKTKVRQAISVVRTWLGTDASGADYLPSGLTAAAAGRYRITDILIDAELFRRLRIRGTARGVDGIADLQAALNLVAGRPFDLPSPRSGAAGGYSWLVDDNFRLDHEFGAMIVDVAHVVATHHLGDEGPQRAAAAAEVALRAGTFEDVPLLDLVAACDALGHRAEADAHVARILANHDAEVEEDLPPRTADILFRRRRELPSAP